MRLHVADPGVTDIGESALRGMANFKELGFTDARATDAAVAGFA